MKKPISKFILFLLLTLVSVTCAVFGGCSNETVTPPESEAEPYTIEISGMETNFAVGGEFSVGELVVRVKQGEDDFVISAENYELDSSQFDSAIEGEYTILVKVPEYELETSYKVTVRESGWVKDYLIP